MQERLAYRIEEVVALTGLSRSSIYRLAKREQLPLMRICGRTLVLHRDLMDLLERGRSLASVA